MAQDQTEPCVIILADSLSPYEGVDNGSLAGSFWGLQISGYKV